MNFCLVPRQKVKKPMNSFLSVRNLSLLILILGISPRIHAEWEKVIVHEGEHCTTAVTDDVNGDGLLDVFTNSSNQTNLFLAPDWKKITLHKGVGCIHSELIDADGDGDLDWVGARYNPGLIICLLRPEKPLTQPWVMKLIDDQVHGIHGLLTGDVDGDGVNDLVATSAQPKPPFPNSLVWYRVPQDIQQAERWPRFVFADQDAPGLTHYLGLGDINGDGRADAATGAKGGPQAEPGTGEWFAWWEAPDDPTKIWKKHLVASKQPGATNIHPGDVNGDGKTDLLASRGHGHGVIWFENPTWKEHTIIADLQEPHCLLVQDLDHDGDLDAATCAYGSKKVAWFENDGRGVFQTHIVAEDQEAYDIRADDMDGDGDYDLLIAGRGSKNVVWYRNPSSQSKCD
jgi:hypothetical protein